MTPIQQPFKENVEWRKLTPEERKGKPWKYVLLKDVFIQVKTGLQHRYNCNSGGETYVCLLPDGIVMKRGYAWNGNSFSPDRILNQCLLFPSLPHDGLFQFSGAMGFPRNIITLRWANWLYLKCAHLFWGKIYYAGLVSGSWALWSRKPCDGDHVEREPIL